MTYKRDLLLDMSKDLLIPFNRLYILINSAPHRYKVFNIPKRSGKGMRLIAQPAREIKRIQYWIIENIFPSLPVHQVALAYMKNKNIRINCESHTVNSYLLKIDFKDFFPSIKGNDFIKYLKEQKDLNFDEFNQELLVRSLFWRPKGTKDFQLSIGAPSSPYLSNAIMFNFDRILFSYCLSQNIIYTRYADDLAFSMEEKAMRGKVLEKVINTINFLPYPKLEINSNKTIFGSKANRRMITGLIISNDNKVSLGRERKRIIRSKIFHSQNNNLSNEERIKLRGLISFANDIEPDFIDRMKKKYGNEFIENI